MRLKQFFPVLMILTLALWLPQTANGATMMADQIPGPHFKAGESVVMTEDLVGDTYVGGATIMIESDVDGDLLVGGGTVTLNGNVSEDLRVGGGNVVVNGTVGQDVTAAGGTVTFGPSSQVGGSVLSAGGMIVFNGEVMGNVWSGAGALQLAGNFDQNVRAEVGALQVSPNAVVGGDLMANYEEEVQVSDQAQIGGEQKIEKTFRSQESQQAMMRMRDFKREADTVKMSVGLVLGLITGLIMMYLFPKSADKVSATVMKQPWASLGWGTLKLFFAPLAIIILMVTVVGLPLAFLMLMGYAASMILAMLVAGKATGEKIYRESKAKWLENRYVQFMGGFVLLKLASLLPLAGWLIKAVAFLMGFGALGMWFRGQIKPMKAKRKRKK